MPTLAIPPYFPKYKKMKGVTTLNATKEPVSAILKSDSRCDDCFLRTYQGLFKKFNVGIEQQQEFLDFYNRAIVRYRGKSAPEIQRELHKAFCSIIYVSDPFEDEKKYSNCIAQNLYKVWKPKVGLSGNSFDLALRLAIAGNIMDYGANNDFDVHQTVKKVLKTDFAIDHSLLLKERISQAKSILYLGDNAGEIVFDKLFLETINHPNVAFAIKNSPILNDATMIDAKAAGIEEVASVISNGYDAPSTLLHKASPNFLKIYQSADLIISKGQGNYEGLMHEVDSRLFFLLMAKCDVISEFLNVEKGSFIVVNQHSTNNKN
jgi:hypothetical protein